MKISLIILYVVLNLYGFILMYVDKQKAKKHEWRISEKHIWIVGIIGGATGLFFGMKKFRHKTKHKQFVILLPVLSIIMTVLYIYILLKLS